MGILFLVGLFIHLTGFDPQNFQLLSEFSKATFHLRFQHHFLVVVASVVAGLLAGIWPLRDRAYLPGLVCYPLSFIQVYFLFAFPPSFSCCYRPCRSPILPLAGLLFLVVDQPAAYIRGRVVFVCEIFDGLVTAI